MAKRIKLSDRAKKAQQAVIDETGAEVILDVYEAPDFVQVVIYIGGDVVTMRVFDDGRMYEK